MQPHTQALLEEGRKDPGYEVALYEAISTTVLRSEPYFLSNCVEQGFP